MKFKQFLNEMAYPSDFSFDEMMQNTSYQKKLRYANRYLRRLASSSSRTVFLVDNEKVLKIAKNNKGLAQNAAESDWGLQQYPLMAKIFEVSEDYKDIGPFWLEMEFAKKVSNSRFQQLTGMTINELTFLLNYRFKYQKSIKDLNERYKKLVNDEGFYYELEKLIADYDFPHGDFTKISSFGEVIRDGKPAIVIVDAGLTKNVWDEYYKRAD